MYRAVFLVPFLILGLSCAPRVAEKAEELPIDTLVITEVPAEVETVYVKTVETVVETVKIAEAGEVPAALVGHPGPFKVQIGAFKNKDYADRLYNSLKGEYGDLYIENIPPYWKVRIGNYRDIRKAIEMRNEMKGRGYFDAWIVPINHFK